MRRFCIVPCGNAYQSVNDFIETWQQEYPAHRLINVDWHCYEGIWYTGITYDEEDEGLNLNMPPLSSQRVIVNATDRGKGEPGLFLDE
jgi:hypothetical protein